MHFTPSRRLQVGALDAHYLQEKRKWARERTRFNLLPMLLSFGLFGQRVLAALHSTLPAEQYYRMHCTFTAEEYYRVHE